MRLRTSGVLVRARCMALGSTFGPGKQMPQFKIRALYLSAGMRHLSILIEYLSDHCERSGRKGRHLPLSLPLVTLGRNHVLQL